MTVSFPPVLADTSALRTSSTKIGAIPSEEALPNEATCHLGFTLLTWFGVSPLFQENIGQMKCNASKQLSSTNSCDNNHQTYFFQTYAYYVCTFNIVYKVLLEFRHNLYILYAKRFYPAKIFQVHILFLFILLGIKETASGILGKCTAKKPNFKSSEFMYLKLFPRLHRTYSQKTFT